MGDPSQFLFVDGMFILNILITINYYSLVDGDGQLTQPSISTFLDQLASNSIHSFKLINPLRMTVFLLIISNYLIS